MAFNMKVFLKKYAIPAIIIVAFINFLTAIITPSVGVVAGQFTTVIVQFLLVVLGLL